ncbi:hypothetical protein VCHA54P499_10247 [Vibrio chagasii]|nr:hypothetical protein VCHA54P499_10247 [Vibrio chagasii]CAH7100320.1 hypothetical protein VCHA53O466_10355 [Vibrio chagasii]
MLAQLFIASFSPDIYLHYNEIVISYNDTAPGQVPSSRN